MRRHTHRRNKVKLKHHMIKEAVPCIKAISELEFVKLIVPDAIDNSSHGTNRMKLSSAAVNGFKLTFGGAGAQKFHIVCDPTDENRKALEDTIRKVAKG